MSKVKKVFLPKWIFWFISVMMLVLIVFFNVSYFSNPQSKAELGTWGWLALNVVFIISILLVYFMSYGGLPAYIIKEEDEEKS